MITTPTTQNTGKTKMASNSYPAVHGETKKRTEAIDEQIAGERYRFVVRTGTRTSSIHRTFLAFPFS